MSLKMPSSNYQGLNRRLESGTIQFILLTRKERELFWIARGMLLAMISPLHWIEVDSTAGKDQTILNGLDFVVKIITILQILNARSIKIRLALKT